MRFGFLAFNAIGETPRATAERPGVAEVRMRPRTGPLDRGDLRRLTSTITGLARQTDVVVALPHWGTQYTNVPVRDSGGWPAPWSMPAPTSSSADIPMSCKGFSCAKGRVVLHSLGNFVFDMDFSRQSEEGVLAELVFWDGETQGYAPQPLRHRRDFAPGSPPGLAPGGTLTRLWRASDAPFRR